MIWTAFRCESTTDKFFYQDFFFAAIASHIAIKNNLPIGIICSSQHRQQLAQYGTEYSYHIEANLVEGNGAQIKLDAITNHLPEGDALCDMDVLWTRGVPVLKKEEAYALNPEPVCFYGDYSDQQSLVDACLPRGKQTANAGFLYAPAPYFKDYSRRALELSHTTTCIGHTYEQMFFVRFCQDNDIPLNFIYNKEIHSREAVESCYKESGIRHPFALKKSMVELQRFVRIGIEYCETGFVEGLLAKYLPMFTCMIRRNVFNVAASCEQQEAGV
jgi:hypothetical protein